MGDEIEIWEEEAMIFILDSGRLDRTKMSSILTEMVRIPQ